MICQELGYAKAVDWIDIPTEASNYTQKMGWKMLISDMHCSNKARRFTDCTYSAGKLSRACSEEKQVSNKKLQRQQYLGIVCQPRPGNCRELSMIHETLLTS